mgnify:FL=1
MLETIVSIIRQAGALLLSAHAKERDISSKEGKANFVTKYDIAVQQFLQQRLQEAFPSAAFLGEEGGASQLKKSGDTFIVDPIDGTTNFITDYRHSSISIGLARDGQMYAGAVYNPYLDEVFSAKKGEGAFLNGARICCGNRPLCEGTVGFGTSPYHPDLCDATFDLLKALYRASLDIRRSGSAALDICYAAAGRTALFFEMVLEPWDYAAASIIAAEAGGLCTQLDGSPITLEKGCSILAGNPAARADFFALAAQRA